MTRNLRIDNLKGLLIILVIIGHVISHTSMESYNFIIYLYIYTIHMPLMILISGYLSSSAVTKNTIQNLKDNTKQLIIPFIVISIIYRLINEVLFMHNGDISYNIFKDPSFATWFLLCLFIYRIIMRYVVRIKHYLLFSFILMLLAFLNTYEYMNYYSLHRMLHFQFYFFFGHWLKHNININELVYKRKYLIPNLLSIIFINSYFIQVLELKADNIYKGDNSFIFFDKNLIILVLVFILSVICTLLFSLFAYNIIPEKKTFLTEFGFKSMQYYQYHIFFLFILDLPFYEFVKSINNPALMTLFTLLTSILIICLCNIVIYVHNILKHKYIET